MSSATNFVYDLRVNCVKALTFTPLWANCADDKLMMIFLFLPENRLWYFMQIVFYEDIFKLSSDDLNWPVYIHWLSWGLTTRQPLWVILCRLPEKGRK